MGLSDRVFLEFKLRLILALSERGSSLDIGCGDQRFTRWLDQPVGIDPYDFNVTHYPPTPNVVDVKATAEFLPFKDQSFKHVHAHDALEHIEDAHQVVGEVYRVLQKNGTFVITVPNDTLLFVARLFAFKIRAAFAHGLTGHGSGHVHRFNDVNLNRLLSPRFSLEKKMKAFNLITGYKFRKRGG